MRTAAIIAEYNPFHHGHAYQLDEVRKHADQIIVLMSGDFVQRGAPALLDKYARTAMALDGGANLVLELPVAYATGSARTFARGAVSMLEALGCVDMLWFGTESGNIDELQEASDVLASEPPVFCYALKRELGAGASYPAAQEAALFEDLYGIKAKNNPELYADFHEKTAPSNALLGLSYMTQLKTIGSRIVPHAIKRTGAGYHDLDIGTEFASASAIRNTLYQAVAHKDTAYKNALPADEIENALSTVPAYVRPYLNRGEFLFLDDLSPYLFYALQREEDLTCFADVSADLAKRIRAFEAKADRFSALAKLLKTKQWTYTRICRALLHILLGICRADEQMPHAVRILGFRDAEPLLQRMKQTSALEMMIRTKDLKSIFPKEYFASELYARIVSLKYGIEMHPEYAHMPIK